MTEREVISIRQRHRLLRRGQGACTAAAAPPLDTGRLPDSLADWAPDDGVRRLIPVENPERLYDFA